MGRYSKLATQEFFSGESYETMNEKQRQLLARRKNTLLSFGNGAERILENKNPGPHIKGLDFNRHNKSSCAGGTGRYRVFFCMVQNHVTMVFRCNIRAVTPTCFKRFVRADF
jgi:hypothetical protein